ncbi:MAG: lysophospholipid acyltransferase family protein [Candidatus Kapabacteria bacterium]|nr:lysophospholipid acyltransferase family protein [Candidatus Kapabacteria bacterium]
MHIIKFYYQQIAIVLVTVVHSIRILLYMAFSSNQSLFHRYSRIWSSIILKISGVKLEIIGAELLNPNEKYIYVANHSSLFDIPVLLAGLNDSVRIMYKKELENIPIFGWGLRKSPFISIVREDPRNAMAGIEKALESISTGDSIIVFPEGTRSLDGKPQTFKRGAFMLAARAAKPIVPISLIGTFSVFDKPNKIFHPTTVKIILHKPIPPNPNSSSVDEKRLMAAVYEIIKKDVEG